MSDRNKLLVELLTVTCFCGFFFFYGLNSFGLVGADEPRYAQVAREMLERHDYITPYLNGVPWLEKPALYYWRAMFAYQLLGVHDWVARMPSATYAFILTLIIFFHMRRFRPGAQVDAALITCSAAAIIGFARGASTDMQLAAPFGIAMLGWYAWYETRKKIWLLDLYIFLAIGTLAKGPVAAGLAGLVVIFFCLLHRDLKSALRTLWLPGIVIYAALVLPWYISVQLQNPDFFRIFFVEHNLERFSTNVYHHHQPWWYYGPVFFLALLPWSIFAIAAIRDAILGELKFWKESKQAGKNSLAAAPAAGSALNSRSNPQGLDSQPDSFLNPNANTPDDSPGNGLLTASAENPAASAGFIHYRPDGFPQFLLLWTLVPVLFFSLSQSKLPGYILPAVPPATILIADYFRRKRYQAGGLGLVAVHSMVVAALSGMIILLPFLLVHPRQTPPLPARLWAAGLAAIFFITMTFTIRKAGLRVVRFSTIVPIIVSMGFLLHNGAPVIDAVYSTRPLALDLAQIETQRSEIAVFKTKREVEYGLRFYRNQRVNRYERGEIPPGDHLVVAPEGSQTEMMELLPSRRFSYLGSFPVQHLQYFWVSTRQHLLGHAR